MKLTHTLIALLFSAFTLSAAQALEVGDTAPDFELPATDGEMYKLSELTEEGVVVLAWFPKAYTRGCTIECKSLAENGHLIKEYKATYFMASVDPLETNTSFAAEFEADFPLLSDESKEVAEAYDVLSMMGFANRHTFYIGADREILAIDESVRPETSAEDMAAMLGMLGTPKN
jgi:peroxiredoxin Q/BCP